MDQLASRVLRVSECLTFHSMYINSTRCSV